MYVGFALVFRRDVRLSFRGNWGKLGHTCSSLTRADIRSCCTTHGPCRRSNSRPCSCSSGTSPRKTSLRRRLHIAHFHTDTNLCTDMDGPHTERKLCFFLVYLCIELINWPHRIYIQHGCKKHHSLRRRGRGRRQAPRSGDGRRRSHGRGRGGRHHPSLSLLPSFSSASSSTLPHPNST